MSSVNDTDLSDSISMIESEDAESDFELVDFELVDFDDDARPQPPSSTHSLAPSVVSDDQSQPPSPALRESRFHFPDPAAIFSEANLDSSSICTIASPTHPEPFSLPPPAHHDSFDPIPPTEHKTHRDPENAGLEAAPERAQSSQDPFFGETKRTRASLLHLKRTALASPKTACLLMLLAAVLLGMPFQSSSLLRGLRTSSIPTNATQSPSNAKFVTPAAHAPTSSLAPSQPAPWFAKSLVPLPSTSAHASIAIVSEKRSKSKRESTALQPPAITPKALTLAPQAHTGSRAKASPNAPGKVTWQRARPRRNPLLSRVPYELMDRPVFPLLSDASSLGEATTTSWDYWLEQLDSYYHVVLRPSILEVSQQAAHVAGQARRFHHEKVVPAAHRTADQATKAARRAHRYHQQNVVPALHSLHKHTASTAHHTADQASKAARGAHRYHQQHVLPALASWQKQTIRTAHQTAEWTAQYNRDQLRPALATLQQQTIETARKSADFQRTVVAPALVQLGSQSIEAAKTASHGLNKAARRFSLEAAETVKQVRHATHINLEALGVDQYVGFLKSTWKGFTSELAICHNHHSQACEPCDCAGIASPSPLRT